MDMKMEMNSVMCLSIVCSVLNGLSITLFALLLRSDE